jgi:hypothetical protein
MVDDPSPTDYEGGRKIVMESLGGIPLGPAAKPHEVWSEFDCNFARTFTLT